MKPFDKKHENESIEFPDQKIIPIPMEKEVKKSFIEYSMSVIGVTSLLDDVFIESVGIFLTTVSTASHCTSCAFGVPVFYVTSCHSTRSNQETSQDVPSWNSLSVPRYKQEQERAHIILSCCASSLVNTRGRRRKQELLLFVLFEIFAITGKEAVSLSFI